MMAAAWRLVRSACAAVMAVVFPGPQHETVPWEAEAMARGRESMPEERGGGGRDACTE